MGNVAMTDKGKAATKIGAVNGLRGIAILMVVMHHLFIPYTPLHALHPGEIDSEGLFAIFINYAWLGVHIFFVLSGFVLHLPYCMKRRSMATHTDVLAFYAHRARRLLPLYYIVVLVTMSLHAKNVAGSSAWYLEFASLLSTLYIFSPRGFMPPSNVVLWSVSVEIWFSLLFPFFVLAIERWRMVRVLLATMAVGALFVIAGKQIPVERIGEFRPFTMGIFAACQEFLLGMLACQLYVASLSDSALRSRLFRLLVPGIAVTIVSFYFMQRGGLWLGLRIANGMMFNIGFTLLLLGVLSGPSPLRWLLQTWPLQVVGCMCYSIYAWHGIMMNEMIPPETARLADTMRLLLPYLAVTLALSILSYRYIEFGRERNWRALFLISEPSAVAAARTVGNSPLPK